MGYKIEGNPYYLQNRVHLFTSLNTLTFLKIWSVGFVKLC